MRKAVKRVLELHDICLSFGEKTVFSGCGLVLPPGDRVALTGPSGCGKTSLLRIALGLQQPDSGSVRNASRRTAAVFQEPRLLPWCTALENVNLVLSDGPETFAEAQAWLDRLELADAAGLRPDALSGGMQQRVALARALAAGPDLLVLDEAFKGLDDELKQRVLHMLADTLPGVTLLMATHSEEEAEALGCRILRCRNGRFEP